MVLLKNKMNRSIFVLAVLFLTFSNLYGQRINIEKLELKDSSIVSCLDYVADKEDRKKDYQYFYLYFFHEDSCMDLRILIDKKIDNLINFNQKESVKGFFLYKNYTVFVYGEPFSEFLNRLNLYKEFTFEQKKEGRKDVFVAPEIYDPIFYIFKLNNNKAIFNRYSFYDLFKDKQ